jgi:DNA-binding transcriptional regulator LsrR (DeoR family)
MKTTTSECEYLRRAFEARESPTAGIRGELRERAVAYARTRSSEGVPQRVIAGEIGVSVVTVGRWLREVPSSSLVPVRVISPSPASSLEVVTPRGLRVVGLDLDSLCDLIERHG